MWNVTETIEPSVMATLPSKDFQVSGTVGRPKTNLMDKLIGRDLKDLSSVITGLIGGGKTEKKKKPAEEPAAAAPSSTVSPAPTASP